MCDWCPNICWDIYLTNMIMHKRQWLLSPQLFPTSVVLCLCLFLKRPIFKPTVNKLLKGTGNIGAGRCRRGCSVHSNHLNGRKRFILLVFLGGFLKSSVKLIIRKIVYIPWTTIMKILWIVLSRNAIEMHTNADAFLKATVGHSFFSAEGKK